MQTVALERLIGLSPHKDNAFATKYLLDLAHIRIALYRFNSMFKSVW